MADTVPLPPLVSSDGHLEVRPERWTPRMPARLREHAPRTIKLPEGGDAFARPRPAAAAGAVPRPARRAHQRDVGALRPHRRGHRRRRAARAARARAGRRRPRGRGAVPQHAARAAPLAHDDRRRRLPRRRARVQRLARRGVLPGRARPADRPRRHPVDEPRRRDRRAPSLREAWAAGRQPRRVSERARLSDAGGRPVLGRGHRPRDAADRARRPTTARARGQPSRRSSTRTPIPR